MGRGKWLGIRDIKRRAAQMATRKPFNKGLHIDQRAPADV